MGIRLGKRGITKVVIVTKSDDATIYPSHHRGKLAEKRQRKDRVISRDDVVVDVDGRNREESGV